MQTLFLKGQVSFLQMAMESWFTLHHSSTWPNKMPCLLGPLDLPILQKHRTLHRRLPFPQPPTSSEAMAHRINSTEAIPSMSPDPAPGTLGAHGRKLGQCPHTFMYNGPPGGLVNGAGGSAF